ncbi:hypothetical protein M0805_007451 [Coniferiporia weirii]|nr:hypothetical protein M0805_007451 [Coniferiporia weirii]
MATTGPEPADFFSSLLTPGSSLNPTFLLILDGAFAALLCIFIVLLFLLSGSIHIIALIGIELCLWASVKWFVAELKTAQERPEEDSVVETSKSK